MNRNDKSWLLAGVLIGAIVVATIFIGRQYIVSRRSPEAAGIGAQGKYNVPRTPDGHPDFQGYWTNLTYTPYERPKELASKPFLLLWEQGFEGAPGVLTFGAVASGVPYRRSPWVKPLNSTGPWKPDETG